MKLQLRYELDPSLLLEGLRAMRRRRLLAVQIYAGLVFLMGLYCLLLEPRSWAVLGWVGVVGGPLTWLGVEFQFRRIASGQMRMVAGPIKADVDEDAIRQQLPAMKSEVRWDLVTRAQETRRLWLLAVSPYQAVHLPKGAFAPGAADEFKAFLRRRGLLGA